MMSLFKLEHFLLYRLEREPKISVKFIANYPQIIGEPAKVNQAEQAVHTILQSNLCSYYFSTMLYIPITKPSIFIMNSYVVFYSGTGDTMIIAEDLFFLVSFQYPKSLHPPKGEWKTSMFQGNINYIISQNVPDLIYAVILYGVTHNYLKEIFKGVDTQNSEDLKQIRTEVGAIDPISANLLLKNTNAVSKWNFI